MSLNKIGKEFVAVSGLYKPETWSSDLWLDTGLRRADEELGEAFAARAEHHIVEEMADVIITLATTCAVLGIDLDSVLQAKHKVNLSRKWASHPTIPGAVKHVKEKRNDALARVRELEANWQPFASNAARLEAENAELLRRIAALEAQLDNWQESGNRMSDQIDTLEAENAKLHAKLMEEPWCPQCGNILAPEKRTRIAENERLRVAFDAWAERDWECYMHDVDGYCEDCNGAIILDNLFSAMEDK